VTNNALIDLHTHTTASDGKLSPADLVATAATLGIQTLAITDHDSVDGIASARAAGERLGVEVISGIELSVGWQGRSEELLGYLFDPEHPALAEALALQRHERDERARTMLDRLAAQGAVLNWEQVVAEAGEGSVGRPHIARALVAAGYVPDVESAFASYLHEDGPAYLAKGKHLSLEDGIALLHAAGGVAALPHPVFGQQPNYEQLELLLAFAASHGLDGLETYYRGYTPPIVASLKALARRYHLVPTGGSDFHGDREAAPGVLGSTGLPPHTVALLRERQATR
jgi:3',5'-nucleoside bisphosphate phosphatase